MYQPQTGEDGFYRTVLVTSIPTTISVPAIMSCIRGGLVVSARVMNTSSTIGHNTMMIVFLKEEAARGFAEYAETHTLDVVNGEERVSLGAGNSYGITFTLLRSATWPLSYQQLQHIEVDKHTRCLTMHRLDEEITMLALCNVLAESGTRHHAVLNANRDSLGTVHLEFSSIASAERAKERSANHPWFRGVNIEFAEDPCNQPLPRDVAKINYTIRTADNEYDVASGSGISGIGNGNADAAKDKHSNHMADGKKPALAIGGW